MRFIVYGAGAIGGLAGARMAGGGADVVLIARGAHAEAMKQKGLTIQSADGPRTVTVRVATSPEGVRIDAEDAVLLGMKSQHTADALEALRAVAPPETAIACLQNGVANERAALRYFRNVYPVCVMCPASHLEPGVVLQHSVPVPGMFDVGRYPAGVDERVAELASGFRAGGFDSVERPDVMRWKYRKLIMNLGNAVQALFAPGEAGELMKRVQAEGEECLRAAGIDCASPAEDRERRADFLQIKPIDGHPYGGGSTWQSLERGSGSVETDFLNGEIGLLGRLHGVPTPLNDLLQRLTAEAAARQDRPGRLTAADVERLLSPLSAS
jgi:2-dehydropantoate 2-reductase